MEKLMNLDKLADEIHHTAVLKGFWQPMERMEEQDKFIFYCKQIAMIHSEATEVLEALRKNKGEVAVVEELADIIIRVLDLYGGMYIEEDVYTSLHDTLLVKINANKDRPMLHGTRG
jgi:NTP pyrophosphatase (non-canonical NTP hydrolase)